MKSLHAALVSVLAVLGLACGACVSPAAGSVPAQVEKQQAQATELAPEETMFATPTRKDRVWEIELSDVSSAFAMEQIKFTTALPLDYAAEEKRP